MVRSLLGRLTSSEEDATKENKVKSRKNSGDSGIEVEDSFVVIPESLTFTKIIDILNNAIERNNYGELDRIVQDIEGYEGQSVTLDNESFRDFCLKQLGLDLQNRGDHQHIYSNILLQYSFDQVNSYPAKELVLSAIAANNKLAKKYQDILLLKEI